MFKKPTTFFSIFGIAYLAFLIAFFGGWIANVVKLVHLGIPVDTAHTTIIFALRILGIVIVPLGAVLGFL